MRTGSWVALVTPMFSEGQIDFDALERLVDFHLANQTDGLVVVGTTGEAATLAADEQVAVVRAVVGQVAKRVPVMAGVGANGTAVAIERARAMQAAGADCLLSVVPYYNKPSQEGLYQHFKAQAAAVDRPLVLYNVPSRTVADLHNDTVLKLAEIDNIVGLKDATGQLARLDDLRRRLPRNWALYSGDDASACAFILCGGQGVISVTANVAPRMMSQLCQAALAGDAALARAINDQLSMLHQQLFSEPNPAPSKWVLAKMGLIDQGIRLPLMPFTESSQSLMNTALKQAGLF